MRQLSAERIHHYDERRSHHYRKRRQCRGTGRARRAGEDLLEEGRHSEERRAQEQESRQGRQSQVLAEEGGQGWKEGQTSPRQGGQHATRRKQGRKDPGTDRAAQRGDPRRDRKSYGLAKTFDPRISLDAKKRGLKIESTKTEAGDRVYQIKK